MMNDFQAAFRVSKMRKALILFWFVFSLCLIVGYFSGVRCGILVLACVLAAAWAWREPDGVSHLWVDEDYQAWLLFDESEEWVEAKLLSGSLIHRWGCCLRWQCDGRVWVQWVLPDMLDKEAFRRLRVWAAFGQKQ